MLRYGDPFAVARRGHAVENYAQERAKRSTSPGEFDAAPGVPLPMGTTQPTSVSGCRGQHGLHPEQLQFVRLGCRAGRPVSCCTIAAGCSARPESSQRPAGRKRLLHTIIPAFMTRDAHRIRHHGRMESIRRTRSSFRTWWITDEHPGRAEAARFTKLTFAVVMCNSNPACRTVRQEPKARGHERGARGSPARSAAARPHADLGGINYGASDPRKDAPLFRNPCR